MDPIKALNESIPSIIETVVAQSLEKTYFKGIGQEKPEKIKEMTTEMLDAMMGYLKTASLAHARSDMKTFHHKTPSKDSGVELKALWTDIIAVASEVSPSNKRLLQQVWEVFNRLIMELTIKPVS